MKVARDLCDFLPTSKDSGIGKFNEITVGVGGLMSSMISTYMIFDSGVDK